MNFLQFLRSRLKRPFSGIWAMFRSPGITRRWIRNSFTGIAIMLFCVITVIGVIMQNSYYSSVRMALLSRSAATASYYYTISGSARNAGTYRSAAYTFVESFENRDRMELQVLDGYGNIVVSSTGFDPVDEAMPDYFYALEADDGAGVWRGDNSNGEHIIAVTHLLSLKEGRSAGALRFVVSLERIDTFIVALIVIMLFASVLVLLLVLVSGNYFISTILVPVENISKAAHQIARGDFSVRIQSEYDDELGKLANSVNMMATELAGSEKLKNDFISSVSHELRTPLTSIKGWSETVSGETDDPELLSRAMGVIARETDRLSVLVEDLLDFSRLQSGRMRMNFEKVDVIAELYEAVMTVDQQARSEDITIITELDAELPMVAADRNRLIQVFINLLDNAIKYNSPGGTVTISAESDRREVRVRIADTGCGIDEHDLEFVTRKFYKANTHKHGFGIGLGVCSEIISSHQGTLGIESTLGVGTTVTVSLPVYSKFDFTAAARERRESGHTQQ